MNTIINIIKQLFNLILLNKKQILSTFQKQPQNIIKDKLNRKVGYNKQTDNPVASEINADSQCFANSAWIFLSCAADHKIPGVLSVCLMASLF